MERECVRCSFRRSTSNWYLLIVSKIFKPLCKFKQLKHNPQLMTFSNRHTKNGLHHSGRAVFSSYLASSLDKSNGDKQTPQKALWWLLVYRNEFWETEDKKMHGINVCCMHKNAIFPPCMCLKYVLWAENIMESWVCWCIMESKTFIWCSTLFICDISYTSPYQSPEITQLVLPFQ